MKPKVPLRCSFPLASAFAALLAQSALAAGPYYWDIDGATAGAGGTAPSGTWSSSGTTWSTSSTGATSTPASTTAATDDLFFSAGTNATGAYTITLTTPQNAKSLTFEEGTATISGASGVVALGGTGGNITVNSGLTATIGNNTNTIIGGTVGLTKLGAGTLMLNGTATGTFTGGLNVTGGTLALDFANIAASTDLLTSQALGFGGGNLTLKGKTGANLTTQTLGNVTLNAGAGALLIDPNNGTSTTLTLGTLTAATSASSLSIGKAITANTGTVTIATTSLPTNGLADGTGIYGGRIVFADGTADTGYDWATTASGSSPYTLSAYSGYTTLPASAGSASVNYKMTVNTNLAASFSVNSLKLEAPTAGLGLGANLLTVNSGGLLSTGATARAINGTAGATRLTAGGGSNYDLIVHQYNSGGLTISVVVGDNAADSKAVSLTKAGPGPLTLSGANTYSGGTFVNSGTVTIGASSTPASGTVTSGPVGTGTVTLSGGTLNVNSAFTIANAIYAAPGTTSGIAAVTGAKNLTLSGNITGSGNLSLTGGNASLILSGDNSGYTGTATVTGSFVRLAPGGGSAAASWVINSGSVLSDQTSTGAYSLGALSGAGTLQSNTPSVTSVFSIGALDTDTTFSGAIKDVTSFGNIALTKVGIGTLTLSGSGNTYTGATTVSKGILKLSHLNAIVNTSSVSVANGATLQAGVTGTFGNTTAVSLVGTGVNAVQKEGALHFTVNGSVWNAPMTLGAAATRISSFGGSIGTTLGAAIGGTGPLTFSSRGGSTTHQATWTLNAASNYSGATTIENNDGIYDVTVKLGANDALPATTSLNLKATTALAAASFATLDLNGFNQTLAGLTDTGSSQGNAAGFGKRVINSSGTLSTLTLDIASGTNTYGTTGTNVLAGTIGGTTAGSAGVGAVAANNLALTKTGAGTLVLAGTNTYTGATAVSGGTLTLAATGSITNCTSVSISAGATLDTSAKSTYAIPAAQPVAFGIDATGSGSCGSINAAVLDVSSATVTYNITGTPDDPVYVLATYTSLSGTPNFLSVPTPPTGYTLNYAYEGNKIALVQNVGNTAPTITDITDQSVTSGSNTGALPVTVGDAETAVGSLIVTGSSSNTTLVPNGNIVIGGSGASRTVTVTPVSGLSGTATITLTVTDAGSLTATDTFVLTVTDNYLSWSTTNSVTGGMTGDSDNDGVKNLVEYALVDGGERGTYSGNVITFNKRLAPYGTDITYGIETSTDLVNWNTPGSGVAASPTAISYTFSPSTPVKEFARLKVVTIP